MQWAVLIYCNISVCFELCFPRKTAEIYLKVRAIFISFLILIEKMEICEQWEKEEVIKTSW